MLLNSTEACGTLQRRRAVPYMLPGQKAPPMVENAMIMGISSELGGLKVKMMVK